MKNANKALWILLIVLAAFGNGCSSSKKGNCGCPNKKGLVGY